LTATDALFFLLWQPGKFLEADSACGLEVVAALPIGILAPQSGVEMDESFVDPDAAHEHFRRSKFLQPGRGLFRGDALYLEVDCVIAKVERLL
tara:strand:+ start:281 stop:559 length:279 start_codon:yes stop_codon:yes gene_type:complete